MKSPKSKKVVSDEPEADGAERRFVPLELITNHPDLAKTYRKLDKEWAADLSTDIEENGLDTPLIVWNEDGDTQVKIAGELHPASFLVAGLHRREGLRYFHARNEKGFAKMFPDGVPVTFKTGDIAEALAAQLRENVKRKDMTPAQIFPVLERLRDEFDMKKKDIAAKIGMSTSWVTEMFNVSENLGEEGVEAITKKGVTLSDARKAAKKMKKAKKAGKSLSVKEVLKKGKLKASKKKKKGRVRADRKLGAKTLYKNFLSLPKMKLVTQIEVLTGALAYLAGEEEEPPDQLVEVEDEDDEE